MRWVGLLGGHGDGSFRLSFLQPAPRRRGVPAGRTVTSTAPPVQAPFRRDLSFFRGFRRPGFVVEAATVSGCWCAQSRRCSRQSSAAAIGCKLRKMIGSRPCSVRGKNSSISWRSGAKQSKFIIWVTRARLTCPRRAKAGVVGDDACAKQLLEADGQGREPGHARHPAGRQRPGQ